jgi:hypothetical protein
VFAGGGRNNTCRPASPGEGARTAKLCPVTPPRAVVPALLISWLATGSLLAGCTGADAPDTASTERGTSSAPATAPPDEEVTADDGSTDVPPFPADAEADTAEASPDAQVTVSDIRIGRHDGFDRVVLEVGGEGLPGWDVRYVDQASSQGKGDPVEVAGSAVLQVTLTGAGYPYDTGVEEHPGRTPLSAESTEVVTEVVFDSTYEGTSVAFVGTTEQVPFRVYLLEDPTRVVIEIAG